MPLLAVAVLAACVPVPPELLPHDASKDGALPNAGFQGLDPGAAEIASLHFVVKAYGSDRARQISQQAETLFGKITIDTGLTAFQLPQLDTIIVYSGRDEYLKKTQQPDWSTGVHSATTLYMFDGPQFGSSLSHEMGLLFFEQYMQSPRLDLGWLREALAVYEEDQEMAAEGLRSDWTSQWRVAFQTGALPFSQMTTLVPATERDRQSDLWYQQAGDVFRFLIQRGGSNGVSQMLNALRDGRSMDDAIHLGFPGIWSSLSDVESAWRASF